MRFPRALSDRDDRARSHTEARAVHLSIGVHRFGHPFIRPHVHAACTRLFDHARGPARTGPALTALYRVRGVADLTKRVVAPGAPGSAFTPPRLPLFLYTSSSNFACARAQPNLSSRQRLASTIAECDGRSSSFLSISSLLSHSHFLNIILFLSFSLPTLLPHSGHLRSYPTYCPFRSNPGCVAGPKEIIVICH